MNNIFEIAARDTETAARAGTLHLPHGDVETPVFMPVGTYGSVKALTKDDLDELGIRLILGNTYHLTLQPGVERLEKAGGLHGFAAWPHNFLTDSGGYQIFALPTFRKIMPEGALFRSHRDGSRHMFTPESVAGIQARINTDIQMQLDICTGWWTSREDAESALQTTLDWGARGEAAWRASRDEGYRGFYFPIVQGNFFEDLRAKSAEACSAMDVPGIAIGGLAVGEPYAEYLRYLDYTTKLLPDSKARYVMGIGTPEYILEAIASGVDMFDCVLPTRNARNGSYFTHHGMLTIKNSSYRDDYRPLDEECGCKICRDYSRAYLSHLFREKEVHSAMLGSYHNVYFIQDMVRGARCAIAEGRFGEYKKHFLARFKGLEA